jgi:hypothetical protein
MSVRNAPSPAEVARERGWTVGTVLRGDPIRDTFGKVLEGPVRIRITAIGHREVLAVTELHGVWVNEGTWTFDARRWSQSSGRGES